MSTTEPDASGRREKVVMGLGILAILLLSANITAVVARHFWPDLPLFGRTTEAMAIAEVPAIPHLVEIEVPDVHRLIRIHRHSAPSSWEFNTDDLERDLRKLEARISAEAAAIAEVEVIVKTQ
ncbi:MAG: hypothetical protein RIE53_12345 [Rhodothermales bacterium]